VNKYFSPDEFEDCFVLQNILEKLDWLKVDYSNEIKSDYNSKLYKLAEVLKKDRQRKKEIGWREEEKLYKEELKEYCINFNIDMYEALFKNVSLILEQVKKLSQGNITWQYESSLNTIFGNLAETDANLFLALLKLNFVKFNFNLNITYVFNRFFQTTPELYFELYNLIKDVDHHTKFCFHETLDIKNVKRENLLLLYSDLLDSIQSLKSQYVFWDLTFVSKYTGIKKEREIYTEILNITLAKIKFEQVKVSVGQHFIEKCISLNSFSFDIIVEAYLYSRDIEKHFDYEKKILRTLLIQDSNVLLRLLKFNSLNKVSNYELEHENFDFIWELDNYIDIIDSILDFYISSETYCFSEDTVTSFFSTVIDKCGNKPLDYLKTIIDKKYLNNRYINVVFSIICNKYPNYKMEFLERFLKLNDDFEIFKNLELIQRSRSWSGSYIPILEGEKKIWEAVISVLDGLPNRLKFYDHKEYANRQIGYCDIRIKDEMKREFYDDFR
jgi:hypothetical protein